MDHSVGSGASAAPSSLVAGRKPVASTEDSGRVVSRDSRQATISSRAAPVAQLQQPQTTKQRLGHFFAGGLGGAAGAIITNPLDVIRTRFQAKHKGESVAEARQSRFPVLRSIVLITQREGLSGLFRGLVPNLVGVIPARSLYFMAYNSTKHWLSLHSQGESALTHSASAAVAGIVTSTAINPLWVVKVRMQLQSVNAPTATPSGMAATSPNLYAGYADCVRKIYLQEGFLAFYKGLSASFLGLSETVIQFVVYERGKLAMQHYRQSSGSSPRPMDYLMIGGVSKLIAASLTYPHEVVRTRMREQRTTNGQYSGLFQSFRTVFLEEGVRGLYSGFGPHMLRVVPNTAIIFGVYEFAVRHLKRWDLA